jgi:hypothetical protein
MSDGDDKDSDKNEESEEEVARYSCWRLDQVREYMFPDILKLADWQRLLPLGARL